MRPFAVVSPALLWAEHIGRQLRTLGPEYQVLAFYLFSAPTSNPYGLYYLSIDQMTHETGRSAASAYKILDAFGNLEFAYYHRAEQWVWVKTMAQMSLMPTGKLLPHTDNRVKGMQSWYEQCVDNPYLGPFFDYYNRAFYLAERREWSRTHDEPAPTLETVTRVDPARALPPATGEPSLFPELSPATSLVPVARRAITRTRKVEGPDPLFLAWFERYPSHRQVEKREAYQQWVKIRPKPDIEWTQRAIATLEKQKQTRDWIKEGGKYVPKPANYLAKGKWDDVVRETQFVPEADVDRAMASYDWANRRDDDDPDQ